AMQNLQQWAQNRPPKDPNAPGGGYQGPTAMTQGPASLGTALGTPAGTPPAGAPGQGAAGGKGPGAGGQGMAPQMQRQIAGLQGGPRPGAPGAPPAALGAARARLPRPGAPGAGPGGQKAPGMQKQIAGLPGGPTPG